MINSKDMIRIFAMVAGLLVFFGVVPLMVSAASTVMAILGVILAIMVLLGMINIVIKFLEEKDVI